MTFKEKVHQHCLKLINDKIFFLQQNLKELSESAANETKSTAGDKHETALAMLQIEQENKNRQLGEVLQQKLVVERIVPSTKTLRVTTGSLVKTNKGFLFVAIGLGRITVEGITVITLSPGSPLGKKIYGLQILEKADMNGIVYQVESIE